MTYKTILLTALVAGTLIFGTAYTPQAPIEIKEVKIGNQIWMAQNVSTNIAGSYSYKNDPLNTKLYGRLYTWEAAKKACPAGWHLPTDAEWKELTAALGGEATAAAKLKVGGASGFDAVYGGFKSEKAMEFDGKNYSAIFWSSTPFQGNTVWAREIKSFSPKLLETAYDKNMGLSCRCVKDK
ncbi:MAG: FISUMP domain-containing protein [Chitinophagales bacterium]|nr:FISUMP domain-containing protein [Chitinophagales bacterium]